MGQDACANVFWRFHFRCSFLLSPCFTVETFLRRLYPLISAAFIFPACSYLSQFYKFVYQNSCPRCFYTDNFCQFTRFIFLIRSHIFQNLLQLLLCFFAYFLFIATFYRHFFYRCKALSLADSFTAPILSKYSSSLSLSHTCSVSILSQLKSLIYKNFSLRSYIGSWTSLCRIWKKRSIVWLTACRMNKRLFACRIKNGAFYFLRLKKRYLKYHAIGKCLVLTIQIEYVFSLFQKHTIC